MIIAEISDAIHVDIFLIFIGEIGAVVAEISHHIAIAVCLIWVRHLWAVVIPLTDAILIIKVISADAPQRALQDQEGVGGRCLRVPTTPSNVLITGPVTHRELTLCEKPSVVVIPTPRLLGKVICSWISLTTNLLRVDSGFSIAWGYF